MWQLYLYRDETKYVKFFDYRMYKLKQWSRIYNKSSVPSEDLIPIRIKRMLKHYNTDIESSDGFKLIVQNRSGSGTTNVLWVINKYFYYILLYTSISYFFLYEWRIAATALLSFALK